MCQEKLFYSESGQPWEQVFCGGSISFLRDIQCSTRHLNTRGASQPELPNELGKLAVKIHRCAWFGVAVITSVWDCAHVRQPHTNTESVCSPIVSHLISSTTKTLCYSEDLTLFCTARAVTTSVYITAERDG